MKQKGDLSEAGLVCVATWIERADCLTGWRCQCVPLFAVLFGEKEREDLVREDDDNVVDSPLFPFLRLEVGAPKDDVSLYGRMEQGFESWMEPSMYEMRKGSTRPRDTLDTSVRSPAPFPRTQRFDLR